jgi:hypothetical protein
MIERLKREHRNFESKLDDADDIINRINDIASATRIVSKKMSKTIGVWLVFLYVLPKQSR